MIPEKSECPRCGNSFPRSQVEGEFSGICPTCLAGLMTTDPGDTSPNLRTNNAKVPIETIRPPLKPGSSFKGFEVLEVLGQGGMGVVYKARQQSLNRLVALKLLNSHLATSEEFVTRFEREAKVLASLNHPNVVLVHDFGKEEGLLYLVMEHVDGPTLEDVMKKKGDPARFLAAVRDVAKGLERVHQAGLVHRDVKPSNILIAKDGTAKISDFGLAIETEGSQKLTQSGMFVGTPHYVSPEHAQGKKMDGRSDLYSLGVILFEGFAGRPPFQAPSATALLLKHVNEPPPALYKLAPQSPKAVQEIVRKLLAKNPAARHDTAASLVRDLDRGIEDLKAPKVPGTARKAPAPVPAPEPSKLPVKWIGAGVAAAAVIAILIAVLGGKSEPPRKADPPEAVVVNRPPMAEPKKSEEKPKEVEPIPDPSVPPPPPAPIPDPKPQPQDPKPPSAVEEALRQGDKLFEEARAAYEEGKARSAVEALTDASFKADAARIKFIAVQEIGSEELKAKAADQLRLIQQFQKLVHESKLAISDSKGVNPAPAPVPAAPAPSNPAAPAPAVRAPVVPAVAPAARSAAPEASTLKDTEKTVRDLFKADYAKKSPADQQQLAQKLLRQGREAVDDPKVRFVLFREARELAQQVGDVETTLAAVDEMAQSFDIDYLGTKNGALAKLSASVRTPEAAVVVAEAFFEISRQAIDGDNYDVASAASTRAEALARSTPELSARIQELRREIAVLKDEYLKVKTSIDKPGTGDQEALGKYYAFVKGDWDRGLEILASSAKPPLNTLAERDLARSGEAAVRAEVGDGWWDLAEREKTPYRKTRIQERTRLWYEAAVGGLTGLVRARVEKRLEALELANKGPVDLLRFIDLTKDGVVGGGTWARSSNGLVSGGGDFFARVMVPYVPPAEYDLAVTVERTQGQQDFYMGLAQGDFQFGVTLNGGNSSYCEIQGYPAALVRAESGVVLNRPTTIVYQVRKNAVEVRVDGRKVLNYKGDLSKGSMYPQWAVPDKKVLFVGSHGSVHQVTRMMLTAVTGKGKALRPVAVSGSLPPAVSTSRAPVDLLALLDPKADAVTGEWTSRGRSLVTPPGTYARIQAPYEVPDEYDLLLQVERIQGASLILGLGGRTPVMLTLDGCGGNVSGLEAIDGVRVDKNESRWNGAVFRPGKKSTVLVSVRKAGISATVDDQKVVDWKGDRSRLSMPNDWQTPNIKAIWLGSWEGVFQIDQAVLTPMSGPGVLLRKPAAVPGAARVVDLLSMIDPKRDAVNGTWERKVGGLVSDNKPFSRLEIPYQPPAEYDLRTSFTRLSGSLDINQILFAGGRQVIWVMAAGNGQFSGFASLRNQWADGGENPTRGPSPRFAVGESHTCMVQVRKTGIKVFVDEQLLREWVPDWSEVSLANVWGLRHENALGLATYESSISFQKVELVEVTGQGKKLR